MATTNPILDKLLRLTTLNRYPDDSLEVMIYIICLIMFADKRIRKGELVTLNSRGPGSLLSTFQDSFDSINSGDFENIQFSRKYPEINLVNILEELKTNAKRDYNWLPSELLLHSAAKKITDVDGKGLLGFDNLTFVPIDKRLMDFKMLTKPEKDWINNYHNEVFTKIGSLLKGPALEWLKKTTQKI